MKFNFLNTSEEKKLGLDLGPALRAYIIVVTLKLLSIVFYSIGYFRMSRYDLLTVLLTIYTIPYLISLFDVIKTKSLRSAYPTLIYLITATALRRFFAEPNYMVDFFNYITYVVMAHFTLSANRATWVSAYGAISLAIVSIIVYFFQPFPIIYSSTLLSASNYISMFMCALIVWLGSRAYVLQLRHVLNNLEQKSNNLHKANEDYRTLFSLIVHDFSNDVSVIFGSLKSALRQPEAAAEGINKRLNSTMSRVENLVDGIANLKKIRGAVESGESLILKSTTLKDIFERTVFTFQPQLDAKKLNLKLPSEERLDVKLLVDPVSFSFHVLNNLVSNAIKFSEPESEIKLNVSHFQDCSQLQIVNYSKPEIVSDVLKNNLSQFSNNKALSQVGTSGEVGQGMGLGIVSKICQKMNIKISSHVEFNEDIGYSKVEVTLLIPISYT